MAATIAYDFFDGLVLLVHGSVPPSNEDWGAYIRDAASRLASLKGVLVVTGGSAPNSAQRSALNDLVRQKGGAIPTAVVTSSVVARGVTTALGWFNPTIRAFSADEIAAALSHLGVEGLEGEVRRRVVTLRKRLAADG